MSSLQGSSTKELKETKELEGYIHCLSPVKDTMNKQANFFDFKVQLKEEIVRGVCFSPEKKEKLEQFQKCKSPIKIRKYGEKSQVWRQKRCH